MSSYALFTIAALSIGTIGGYLMGLVFHQLNDLAALRVSTATLATLLAGWAWYGHNYSGVVAIALPTCIFLYHSRKISDWFDSQSDDEPSTSSSSSTTLTWGGVGGVVGFCVAGLSALVVSKLNWSFTSLLLGTVLTAPIGAAAFSAIMGIVMLAYLFCSGTSHFLKNRIFNRAATAIAAFLQAKLG